LELEEEVRPKAVGQVHMQMAGLHCLKEKWSKSWLGKLARMLPIDLLAVGVALLL
jgi:hypothetical protein